MQDGDWGPAAQAANDVRLLAEKYPEFMHSDVDVKTVLDAFEYAGRRAMAKATRGRSMSDEIGGIEVLQLARQEIVMLRKEVDHLRPLADAYQVLAKAVGMIGGGGYGQPMTRDVVDIIDNTLKDIQKAMAADRNSGQVQAPSGLP